MQKTKLIWQHISVKAQHFKQIVLKLSNKCILRYFCSSMKYRKKKPKGGGDIQKTSAFVCDESHHHKACRANVASSQFMCHRGTETLSQKTRSAAG